MGTGGLVMSKGYTLIEVLVVLVVMGLAAALVAPALLPRRSDPAAVVTLVRHARAAAIRRAEAISLRIEAGAWRMDGAASLQAGAIATGRLPSPPPAAVTLVFSPLGSCSPDVESAAAGQALGLDPLTCEAAGR